MLAASDNASGPARDFMDGDAAERVGIEVYQKSCTKIWEWARAATVLEDAGGRRADDVWTAATIVVPAESKDCLLLDASVLR